MALILSLETSTSVLSVALAQDGVCIAAKEIDVPNSHAEKITIFIDAVMQMADMLYEQLDAIAVSGGPGSYTGLRIGVSSAKGLCYAMDIPLISVSTLQSMAFGMVSSIPEEDRVGALVCPMIDARRMEVYDAVYTSDNQLLQEDSATIIDGEQTYSRWLSKSVVYFGGDGALKASEVINSGNAVFLTNFRPSAKHMCMLSYNKFLANDFVDKAYFEPFYMKKFIAAPSKVKGLF